MPQFPSLQGERTADVLIIGAGAAGILCAWLLSERGVDCVVAEADRVCGGITKNTTAKITAQHGLLYDKLLRRDGEELARKYLEINLAALERYRELSRGIGCELEERDSFVYSLQSSECIEREVRALDRLGYKADFVSEVPLPFATKGAVRFPRQAQMSPLELFAALASDLAIYEQTAVREVRGGRAITDRGAIMAKKIIVATHFPFINKHGGYFLKMYQQRSYVVALEGAPSPGGMYVDEAEKGLSFRDSGDILLLGGGSHRTGKQGGGWRELEQTAARLYPQAQIKYRWATQDCMTLDSIPYIGRYSRGTPELYVATGFNKWGMTSSMAAAMVLADLVTERENPYAELFEPSRSMLHPQLAVNCLESVSNLLMPTTKRCPHMGCALRWNAQEHTWDCPCHGSRFSQDGRLIDNPATADLGHKEP